MVKITCRCGSVHHKRLLDLHFLAESRQSPSVIVGELSLCPWKRVKYIVSIDLQEDYRLPLTGKG